MGNENHNDNANDNDDDGDDDDGDDDDGDDGNDNGNDDNDNGDDDDDDGNGDDDDDGDCNNNGVDDSDDIAEGTSEDCNGNEVPDECDLAAGTGNDEDDDDCMDECDDCPNSNISLHIVINDCPTGVINVVLEGCTFLDLFVECAAQIDDDEAFLSCVVDLTARFVAEGLITVEEKEAIDDCADNGDDPDDDCNNNGVKDEDEIGEGTSEDCNGNGVPDECDLAAGTGNDEDDDDCMDECDDCPNSNVSLTVTFDGCATGVTNVVLEGCTLLDLLIECVFEFQDNQTFISCVADVTARFELEGLITFEEKEAIAGCAGG